MVLHPGDHYVRGGGELRGVQAMRIRHLARMGFRVLQLDERLVRRKTKYPRLLTDYVSEQYYDTLASPST